MRRGNWPCWLSSEAMASTVAQIALAQDFTFLVLVTELGSRSTSRTM